MQGTLLLTTDELDFLLNCLDEYEEEHSDMNQREWASLKVLREKLEAAQ